MEGIVFELMCPTLDLPELSGCPLGQFVGLLPPDWAQFGTNSDRLWKGLDSGDLFLVVNLIIDLPLEYPLECPLKYPLELLVLP
jgi:hypothetical protein